jgi:methanogenic corrinoid protein MtbC1
VLKWCAYCQEFQGEGPPYDDLRITHGICSSCEGVAETFDTADLLHARRLQHIQARLTDAGANFDPQTAADVIEDASKANVRAIDALMGIVAPMLYEVGVQWERAVISVEDEHRFTSFCEELFDLVSERIAPRLPELNGESVVLMNAPGNHHVLALRILTLWLSGHGVRSCVVGPNEGLDDLLAMVRLMKPGLILVSVALPEQRAAVVDVVKAISGLPEPSRPAVVVGGYAVKMGMMEPIPGTELAADISELPTARLAPRR